MATAAAPGSTTRVPLEVYLNTAYEYDPEYIDGTVVERPMPTRSHAMWQDAICGWFRQHADEWHIEAYTTLRVKVSEENCLIPDVAVLSSDAPFEDVVTHPPMAVFEVWRRDSSIRKLMRKLSLYGQMGIDHIWHVDPSDGIWQKFVDHQLVDVDLFIDMDRQIQFNMAEVGRLVR